jgi:Anaerobic ribonucleoside-triphosphate reductase
MPEPVGAAPAPRLGAEPGLDAACLPDEERTPCEIWTRVMGYHRPVSAWNPGKRQEHRDRRQFRLWARAALAGPA